MLAKFFFAAAIFGTILHANESVNKINIYALDVQKNGEILEANDDVVIYSDFYFITANKALYNDKTKVVELFGDVNVLRGANERSHSNYAKIKLDTNEADFNDFFFSNSNLEVWFKSKTSSLNKDKFKAQLSAVSSCNVEEPDWEIRFDDGYLNRESNFVHLYNAKLYIKEIPVFYLPYFGFSADTNRQTGLLVPKLYVTSKEGLNYVQPLFIAPYESWDLELTPQIRTSRGYGVYSNLRFVDSLNSYGELDLGAFREFSSYYNEQNLRYQTHLGMEFRYYRDELVKTLLGDNFQEGLFVDSIFLRDIDYQTLASKNSRNLTSLVTSKLNYFLADEKNFYAAYAKHYIDTSKVSNATTMQEYPSFQYHRFLSSIFDELLPSKILYSFDVSFNNYYRREGDYANVFNFNLPISYHQRFFDGLFNFSLKELFYASLVNYNNYSKAREHYYRNLHEFNFYTDLAKAYDSFYHTLSFGARYTLPGAKGGEITSDYLTTRLENENIALYTTQYFYNENGEKKIKHYFDVSYLNKRNDFDKFNNKITYFYNDNINFTNELIYDFMTENFSNVLTQSEVSINPNFNATLSHAYQNDEYGKYSFLGTQASFNINANYQIFGGLWLDIGKSYANMYEAGFTYQRKCWNYSLAYRKRIDPQLTSAGISARNLNGVYFLFNFYPIGGVKYDFKKENENKI